jgi:hypothetical protein
MDPKSAPAVPASSGSYASPVHCLFDEARPVTPPQWLPWRLLEIHAAQSNKGKPSLTPTDSLSQFFALQCQYHCQFSNVSLYLLVFIYSNRNYTVQSIDETLSPAAPRGQIETHRICLSNYLIFQEYSS